MHSPDDKNYPLASAKRPPRPRRAVSKQDFKLPKPYRRQLFSEEPEGLTRLQIGMLGFGALLTATLIAVLALLAKESDHSPEGKVIVAAASLEPVEPVDAHAAAVPALAVATIPPALQEGARSAVPARASAPAPVPGGAPTALKAPLKAKAQTLLAAAPKKAPQSRAVATLLAREKKRKPARSEPVISHPAPDPDVALITAILLLTPAPAPVATPAVALELAGRAPLICTPATPKHLACTEVHMTKP